MGGFWGLCVFVLAIAVLMLFYYMNYKIIDKEEKDEIERKKQEAERQRQEKERLRLEAERQRQEAEKKYLEEREREFREAFEKEKKEYDSSLYNAVHSFDFKAVLKDAGMYGEYHASLELYKIPNSKLLLSLIIPKVNANNKVIGYYEIDSVLITKYGIDVIEVKNRDLYWMIDGMDEYCDIDTGKVKEKTRNPFLQNKNHTEEIKKLINRKGLKKFYKYIFNYVIFEENTKGFMVKNVGKCKYTDSNNIYDELYKPYLILGDVFSEEEVDGVYEALLPYQNNSFLIDKHDKYLEYVQNGYNDLFPLEDINSIEAELLAQWEKEYKNI